MRFPSSRRSWFRYASLHGVVAVVVLLAVPSMALAAGSTNTFKTICQEIQTPAEPWADDPILYPGQVNAGPDQEFFGNTFLNPSSTGNELVADGAASHTTCMDRFDTAGYWVPTLYRDGVRVVPTRMDAYYNRIHHLTDSAGNPLPTVAVPPTDFRMSSGLQGATSPQPQAILHWQCIGQPGSFQFAPPACPRGYLGLVVRFPSCWDGQNDRLANNANNVAYVQQNRGASTCPAGFGVAVPEIVLTIHYDVAALPDCHLVPNPQDGQNCYLYTLSEVNPATGQRDDQGSIYGGYARFLNGWDATPDPSGKDFTSLIQNVDNAPDGAATCIDSCTTTTPKGDGIIPLHSGARRGSSAPAAASLTRARRAARRRFPRRARRHAGLRRR